MKSERTAEKTKVETRRTPMHTVFDLFVSRVTVAWYKSQIGITSKIRMMQVMISVTQRFIRDLVK